MRSILSIRFPLFASMLAACLMFAVTSVALTSSAFASDPIPGVDVILKNQATGAISKATTDKDGQFTVSLPEGTYGLCIAYTQCVRATDAAGNTSSADRRSYTGGKFMLDLDQAAGIAVGDVNGDGMPDVVAARDQATGQATGIAAPRDLATGQASGKRQHKPITITKEWGAATPMLSITVSGKAKEFKGHVTLMK